MSFSGVLVITDAGDSEVDLLTLDATHRASSTHSFLQFLDFQSHLAGVGVVSTVMRAQRATGQAR